MIKVLSQIVNRFFHDEESIIFALLVLFGTLLVYFVGDVLAPLFAAMIFAYILTPLVDALTRLKIPRNLVVGVVSLLFLLVVGAVLLGLIPVLWSQFDTLVREVPRMIAQMQSLIVSLPEQLPEFISQEQADRWLSQVNLKFISDNISGWIPSLLSVSLATIPGAVSLLIYLIVVPLMVFFLLKDQEELWGILNRLLPRRRRILDQVGIEMNIQIANYIRGKFIEIIIVGGVSFVVFSFFGLNYAALLSILVGLSVLIPYIGAVSVTLPIALVGLFQWGLEPNFYWLMLAYLVIQMLDGNVLVPLLFSEANSLHPIAIIVAVLFFGGIWGFWGVFFAIPLATLVKAIYNAWPRIDQNSSSD